MEIKITLDPTEMEKVGKKILEAGHITGNDLRFLLGLPRLQSQHDGGFGGNRMPETQQEPREIIFCGTRLDGGGKVEGFLIVFEEDIMGIIPCGTNCQKIQSGKMTALQTGFYEIDPSTVAQYTGKVDKTGRKIFERDRVRHYNVAGGVTSRDGTVAWDEGAAAIVWDDAEYGKSFLKYMESNSIAVL